MHQTLIWHINTNSFTMFWHFLQNTINLVIYDSDSHWFNTRDNIYDHNLEYYQSIRAFLVGSECANHSMLPSSRHIIFSPFIYINIWSKIPKYLFIYMINNSYTRWDITYQLNKWGLAIGWFRVIFLYILATGHPAAAPISTDMGRGRIGIGKQYSPVRYRP